MKISPERFMLHVIFWIAYGVALHDFAHQVYKLKGTVWSLEGGYVGFLFLGLTGFFLLYTKLCSSTLKQLHKKLKVYKHER